MRKQYFTEDSYKTSPDRNESSVIRRIKRLRLVFVFRLVGIVFRSRRRALDGNYDFTEWANSSFEIFKRLEDSGAKFNITGLDNIRSLKEQAYSAREHLR